MPLNEDMRLGRKDYADAQGYDVDLVVSYKRTRKVRATDEKQASMFAVAREKEYAQRYFNSASHISYEVMDVEAIDVRPASERLRPKSEREVTEPTEE